MTTTPPTKPHVVLYLDGARGWQPTNLGHFEDPTEAATAAREWTKGYARTHNGHRPPTRVVPLP